MASKRKQVLNRSSSNSNFTKSAINRKRPEKSNGSTVKKTIRKRHPALRSTSGVLRAARPERRTVLLDACNVSHYQNRLPRFSVERLAKALEYFVENGHEVYAVFPRFHLYTGQWDNVDRLKGLYRKSYIVPTPCKEFPCAKSQVYDDRILMAIAAQYQCAVVSNDRFRDVASEHPDWAFVAANRRLPFDWDSNGRLAIYNTDALRFD